MNDLVTYSEAAVAHALRRLADAAVIAAMSPSDPHLLSQVEGKVSSLQHARAVLSATRRGLAA